MHSTVRCSPQKIAPSMARLSLVVVAAVIVAAAWSSRHRVAVDAEIVGGLRVGFYDQTCPDAESTVREIVNSDTNNDPTIPAGLIRIFFHDCFVKVRSSSGDDSSSS
jgi:hypothetical protein